MKTLSLVLVLFVFATKLSIASGFGDGPVIYGFGNHSPVKLDQKVDDSTRLKVVFDVAKSGEKGKHNRHIDSVARFLNMNVANGVKMENIELAIVVHGKASEDLLENSAFKARRDAENSSIKLIDQLLKHNVRIYLCGQSAAYHGIENKDLIEGVQMSLSAMTAHALLSQKGYSLNPF